MENLNVNSKNEKIPKIRAYTDFMYFLFFVIGVFFNIIFHLKVFKSSIAIPIGIIILMFATILIFWTQKTVRVILKENPNKKNFYRGPYRYTRSPVHLGLFLLLIGLGLVANSFFISLFAIIAFVIGKFIFLNKEEKVLLEKYGTQYLEYKKLVRF